MSTATPSQGISAAALSQLVAGILGGQIRVVDLTVPLEPATPTIQLPPQFAPSKPFALEEISHYDARGPAWYWNNIACGEHTGTHFDAPIHWVTGKDHANNATHSIPVDRFIGPACVIDVALQVRHNADFLVTRETVEEWEQQHGRIPAHAWVLIRTDWSRRKSASEFLNMAAAVASEALASKCTPSSPRMSWASASTSIRCEIGAP